MDYEKAYKRLVSQITAISINENEILKAELPPSEQKEETVFYKQNNSQQDGFHVD